jgi:hypothetical protein
MPGYRIANLDAVDPVEDHGLSIDAAWLPVRHHLGIGAFGINAYIAEQPGEVVIEDHDEADLGHQELYVVIRGRAEFTLGEETAEAPAGTFVFFEDPALRRKAVALEPGTAVVAVGAEPGRAFSPSEWETRRTASLPAG